MGIELNYVPSLLLGLSPVLVVTSVIAVEELLISGIASGIAGGLVSALVGRLFPKE